MSKQISLDGPRQSRCPPTKIVQAVTVLATLALFIIGSVAAGGHFPGSTVGWITVGLGCGVGILGLGAKGRERKYIVSLAILTSLCFLSLGVVGGLGILPAQQVGYGILGTFAVSGFCWGGIKTHCTEDDELDL